MGITDPTEEYFKDGAWGWDGTRWRKLALVWGYTDTLRLSVSDDDSAAGTINLITGSVPAGEIWVVQLAQINDRSSAATRLEVQVRNGGLVMTLVVDYSPVADHVALQAGQWVLAEGEFLSFWFLGVTLHDNIEGYVAGYKMKVT